MPGAFARSSGTPPFAPDRGFGSKRRNEAAQALLPLSPAPGASMTPWNDPGWNGIRHPTQT